MLFSYNGSEPQELPERIKFPGGRTHYLSESPLSQAELEEAGWTGPHEQPGFVLGEERVVWDAQSSTYKAVKLEDEEKSTMWATKSADNARKISELRDIANNRKEQYESLGLTTLGVDQFLTYLNASELPGQNPFLYRIPPLSLISATSTKTELNDPFSEWLIEHFESNLAHGYHVEGNQLQVRDEKAFEAHKQAVATQFLTDYLDQRHSAVAFASQLTDNFNGTGEVLLKAYGTYDSLTVELDGTEISSGGEVVEIAGSGNHNISITPLKNGAPCGNTDELEFSLI
jgi:hypothetical protein